MKTALLAAAAAAIVLSTGTAFADSGYTSKRAPFGWGKTYHSHSRVTPYEREQIREAAQHLRAVKARAAYNGHVSFVERIKIQAAKNRLTNTIQSARH
ncbi:MAG: hypothetical protein ABI391_03365 [Hyphomicrobiaceae bacterium]